VLGSPVTTTDTTATWLLGSIEVSVIYELRTPSVGIYIERRSRL
jgi:hypothetical protein